MAKGKSVPILGGRARLLEPTDSYHSWRATYADPITLKRRTTSATSKDAVTKKVAALLGDSVQATKGVRPPTLQEVFERWINSKRSGWSARTVDAYEYLARRFLDPIGEQPISAISPIELSRIDVSDLSRGQQEKVRSLLRGVFTHGAAWLHHDVETYAQSIILSGTKGSRRNPEVQKGDIPDSKLVASLIVCAYHTAQIGPLDILFPGTTPDDPRYISFNEVTGEKTRHSNEFNRPKGVGSTTPLSTIMRNGLPVNLIDKLRRGIPKHYSNPEQRRTDETKELASRFRQVGLVTALGAAGGLRIGEVLALRVRHFLSTAEINQMIVQNDPESPDLLSYRGHLRVEEQASQSSKGKIWVTEPKWGSTRDVHLPAFLPSWHEGHRGSLRDTIVSSFTSLDLETRSDPLVQGAPHSLRRFRDRNVSLWTANAEESRYLWQQGFTPIGWLLWQRLLELWDELPQWKYPDPDDDLGRRIGDFRDLLLFPTRNPERATAKGPHVQFDDSWNHDVRIVEGFGTYQSQTNYAGRLANPLYDYVASAFPREQEFPSHRRNAKGRKGWTHHGLRHWAVTSRLSAGVPLNLIKEEMGHKHASFTIDRYGHLMGNEIPDTGFEY